ncbi:MAG: Asp-tRNA(Asn)/Glu-tRNA(Gln) amidotransferase subunit GatB [Gammaproteobacteria bacterium WSBS_2016_MAG_OTU1]
MTWETVIGLEIHAQLATNSKIFSPAAAGYCDSPNEQVREVDCGLPGALPTLNRTAVEYAMRLGLALDSKISPLSEFARKNYFYPDLPKGYQISQFEYPIVVGGQLLVDLPNGEKVIGITRAHLEEDAGKLLHDVEGGSGVDLNRAGAPLLEIVSEPHMCSAAEAVAYAKTMHQLVCWLKICDGNMQEGSFRMDANISLRHPGEPLGTRCEIKNLNSFRFLEQALEYEIIRQRDELESGEKIIQQTRLFDTSKGQTRAMRNKEDAHDYRYFPDPDLPPLSIDEQWISQTRTDMPELPRIRKQRFSDTLGLSPYDAGVLCATRELADYYEATLAAMTNENEQTTTAKLCANWIGGEFSAMLNKHHLSAATANVSSTRFAGLLRRLAGGDISAASAKIVLEKMWDSEEEADTIIKRDGLEQISDSAALEKLADDIIAANPKQVEQFKEGKDKLFGFFVGQMMKATQGRGNPAQINQIMRQKLTPDS